MRRWSKLQSALYRIVEPSIRFQIQCRVVRMSSSYGSTNLPRYWITLGRETIWSYPGQFVVPGGATRRVDSSKLTYYPHVTDVPAISDLIREYIDTPVAELLTKQFANDHWGLVNILRAADRRIGQRQLPLLRRKIHNLAALKVLDVRQPAAVAKRQRMKASAATAHHDVPADTKAFMLIARDAGAR
jgi:hypothetical protein